MSRVSDHNCCHSLREGPRHGCHGAQAAWWKQCKKGRQKLITGGVLRTSHMHAHTHVHTYRYIHAHTSACTHTHTRAHTLAQARSHIHTYMHVLRTST